MQNLFPEKFDGKICFWENFVKIVHKIKTFLWERVTVNCISQISDSLKKKIVKLTKYKILHNVYYGGLVTDR